MDAGWSYHGKLFKDHVIAFGDAVLKIKSCSAELIGMLYLHLLLAILVQFK